MAETSSKPMGSTYSNQKFGGQMLASREKYWKELKTDEKIERLRTLVKSQVSDNNSLRGELLAFKRHTHNAEGKAVITTNLEDHYESRGQLGTGSMYPGAKEDEVYI